MSFFAEEILGGCFITEHDGRRDRGTIRPMHMVSHAVYEKESKASGNLGCRPLASPKTIIDNQFNPVHSRENESI